MPLIGWKRSPPLVVRLLRLKVIDLKAKVFDQIGSGLHSFVASNGIGPAPCLEHGLAHVEEALRGPRIIRVQRDLPVDVKGGIVLFSGRQDLGDEKLRVEDRGRIVGKSGADLLQYPLRRCTVSLLEERPCIPEQGLRQHLMVRVLRFKFVIQIERLWVILQLPITLRLLQNRVGDHGGGRVAFPQPIEGVGGFTILLHPGPAPALQIDDLRNCGAEPVLAFERL